MEAIVFDLDGTLLEIPVPYNEVLRRTFHSVTGESRESWLRTYDERFGTLFGACDPDPVTRAFASVDADADPERLADTLLDTEAELAEPTAGVRDTLDRLDDEYALAVLTNGMPDWQRRKLRAAGLDHYFDAVATSYDVGAHKPSSDPYRAVERLVGADSYAMVGDSEDDVSGARGVGWKGYRYHGDGFEPPTNSPEVDGLGCILG